MNMGRCLIKLTEKDNEWYLEWSSVVDAPITYGMSLKELREYIKVTYGTEGLNDLESRLERVEKYGTSYRPKVEIDDLLEYNRAGKNEKSISKKQIIKIYCHQK
jgi:hypothetical protein